jgi:phosphinothricin acetyltransferase
MDNILFKPIKEKDLPEILDIYCYYIKNSTATCQIDPIDLAQMKKIVLPESSRYKSFVIYCDESICGYILFTRFKEREAFNNTAEVTIYLKPSFTGKGIGGRSLSKIETEAKAAGIHTLVALISSENECSIKLFERNKYLKCADFKEVSYKFGRYFGLTCYQKMI